MPAARTYTALMTTLLVASACTSDGSTAPDLDQPLPPLASASLQAGPFAGALGTGTISTAQDARVRALVIFPNATITDVDLLDTERGLPVAEVKLLPAGGGGEVKLHFALQNGLLASVESDVPPFTYTFDPGFGFVTLAQAIAAATGPAGRQGTVTEWKLQLEENGQWQYRVWVDAGAQDWRVRVNARTGLVNRVQER